jgi:single-stranded-DNA-specific exonuclease
MTALDTAMADAREVFQEWIGARDQAGRIVVFCHFDADGLAAGALFGRALPRLGFADVRVVPSGRGESAFSDGARRRIAALEPASLIVTDLGVNRLGVLSGLPTLYVDHHRPEGEPAGAAVVSGYEWDPIPTSAWLAYDLLRPLAQVDDLLWIAAVGTLSDLGDAAPWPQLQDAKQRFTAKWLKEAVVLVNAARRASAFDVETPLTLLLGAEHPRALAQDEQRGAERLRAYRAEVNAELKQARRAAPVFAVGQPWALVRLHSACQIHPLIAQQWRACLRAQPRPAARSEDGLGATKPRALSRGREPRRPHRPAARARPRRAQRRAHPAYPPLAPPPARGPPHPEDSNPPRSPLPHRRRPHPRPAHARRARAARAPAPEPRPDGPVGNCDRRASRRTVKEG